MILAGITKRG